MDIELVINRSVVKVGLYLLGLLRDPMWQFFGVLFAIIAIFVSIVVAVKQRAKKQLTYEVVSNSPILSVKENVKGKLEIIFEGNPVTDVHLIYISIMNSGNQPIISRDYERPLSISAETGEILSAEISKTIPRALEAEISFDKNMVSFSPSLLNPGDVITTKLLVSKFSGEILISGRIVGVSKIEKFKESLFPSLILLISGILVTAYALYRVTVLTSKVDVQIPNQNLYVFLITLGYFLIVGGIIINKRIRKSFVRILKKRFLNKDS